MNEKTELTGSAAIAEAGRGHLNRIFQLLSMLNGKTSPVDSLEEETFRIREGYHKFRLEPVESEHPDIDFSQAGESNGTELAYFGRTMQRTQLIGHYHHKGLEIPVHYSITGSIILERKNRRFKVWKQPALRFNVLLPFKYVPDQTIIEEFNSQTGEMNLIDTGGDRPEYTQFRISAVRRAYELTRELRRLVFGGWRDTDGKDQNRVMVGRGHFMDVPNHLVPPNFIGNAREVYVPWQNSELLEPQLLIKPYHRGQLLKVINTEGGDPMPKYTWFVRLRTSSQADPEFGLLRCTIGAKDDQDATNRANEFTAQLLKERLPVTYPEKDWDRLIFPLKVCMDYLESLVPTRDTVKSYFARN